MAHQPADVLSLDELLVETKQGVAQLLVGAAELDEGDAVPNYELLHVWWQRPQDLSPFWPGFSDIYFENFVVKAHLEC